MSFEVPLSSPSLCLNKSQKWINPIRKHIHLSKPMILETCWVTSKLSDT